MPPSPAVTNSSLNGQANSGGLPSSASSQANAVSPPPSSAGTGALPPRDFANNDDFPALGGFADLAQAQAAAAARGGDEAACLSLQQQQQQQSLHRANLLGSMNGLAAAGTQARAVSGAQAFAEIDKRQQQQQPWAFTPAAQQPGFPTGPTGFPTNGAGSIDLAQQQLRSPISVSASAALAAAQQAQRRGVVGSGALATPDASADHQSPALSGTPQTPAQQVLFSPADRYGLLGLLHLIKASDPDRALLALGSDLTTLGLDLGASDSLYSNFITPWTGGSDPQSLLIEPEFHLPACYNVQPPPAQGKIGNFSDETLFFIFYSQPRDSMQEMAAMELYKHNWRYHKELRLWLTKEAGTEPTQKTPTFERGSYM